MAGRAHHRRFGSIRKLASGRYQARYLGPDGLTRSAPETFERKRDAELYLGKVESLLVQGEWTDPNRAKVSLSDYAERWVAERAGLRPRTVELYRWLLKKHVLPMLGPIPLGKLSTPIIRNWRAELLVAGVSETMAAKAYRLLRAVLNTAVEEDRIIPRNPCRVRGADREVASERPVLSVAQVFELADAMPFPQFRALILLASFATLRWGEVTALRRCDVAADGSSVRVTQAHIEVAGQGITVGPPKSRAGVRTVAVPEAIRADIVTHLAEHVEPDWDALMFRGPRGAALRRGNFNPLVDWTRRVADLGVPGLHFHDLRHTGNVLAAQTGASTRDLMARMGHDDMRAALIYQRATSEADQLIADRLSGLVLTHRSRSPRPEEAQAAAEIENEPETGTGS
jgi:integrase